MKKFTIILLHYNQERYLETSLNSILEQDYPNIELIIADDCSSKFDKEAILEYLKRKNSKINVDFVINKKNLGTVKTINKCIEKVNGEYFLFFAADDRLSTKHTITDYIETFKKHSDDADVICFQGRMYNTNLNGKYRDFMDSDYGEKLNDANKNTFFEEMCKECVFVAGATAYKKSIFNKEVYFDEKYKLIEDWPFYIKSSRLGIKYHYENIPGLDHRDGGVSHHIGRKFPPHVIQFYNDIFKIYEFEIMPYMKKLSFKTQIKILSCFNYYRTMYGRKMGIKPVQTRYFKFVNFFYNLYKSLVSLGGKIYKRLFRTSSLVVYLLIGQLSFINYILTKDAKILKILSYVYILILFTFFARLFVHLAKKILLWLYHNITEGR